MPLPILALLAVFFLIGVLLFFFIRWWIERSGAALLFTISLLLNMVVLVPLVFAAVLGLEVKSFQDNWSSAPKVFLVEKGPDVLMAASFTEVKDLEKGLTSFKPLTRDQLQRVSQAKGDARYKALTQDYAEVFVVRREFFDKLAALNKAPSQGSQSGSQGPASSQQDPAAVQKLLAAAYDAAQSGNLDRVAQVAVELQKAFRDRGNHDGVELARQLEQAAKAKDLRTLSAIAPRLAQYANTGGASPSPGPASGTAVPGGPGSVVPNDVILKIIDSNDPIKDATAYVPSQVVQQVTGGDPVRLKMMMMGILLQNSFPNGPDYSFLLTEYKKGDIRIYPEGNIAAMVKLLPVEQFGGLLALTTPNNKQ